MTIDVSTLQLVQGLGDGKNTACLMSARALLDGRGLTNHHPSATIRAFGVAVNDGKWWQNDEERTRTLRPIALDERLSAKRVQVTPALEQRRAYRLADAAVRSWAPRAFDAEGHPLAARRLRNLQPVRDERTADAAYADAAYAANYATNYAAEAAAGAAEAAEAAANYAAYFAAYAAIGAHRASADPEIKREAIALILELATMTEEAPS